MSVAADRPCEGTGRIQTRRPKAALQWAFRVWRMRLWRRGIVDVEPAVLTVALKVWVFEKFRFAGISRPSRADRSLAGS
jgi:hypothetical protein